MLQVSESYPSNEFSQLRKPIYNVWCAVCGVNLVTIVTLGGCITIVITYVRFMYEKIIRIQMNKF